MWALESESSCERFGSPVGLLSVVRPPCGMLFISDKTEGELLYQQVSTQISNGTDYIYMSISLSTTVDSGTITGILNVTMASERSVCTRQHYTCSLYLESAIQLSK